MTPFDTAIAAYFAQRDWAVEHVDPDDPDGEVPEAGSVSVTSVKGVNGVWPLVVGLVGDHPPYLIVQSIVPPIATAGDEVGVLELLARLNDGLVAGCWELNFDDGTIRLRSSVPVGSLAGVDHQVLVNLVDDVVTANVVAADRFIPALEAIIDHRVAPAIAVAAVDAGLDPTTFGA